VLQVTTWVYTTSICVAVSSFCYWNGVKCHYSVIKMIFIICKLLYVLALCRVKYHLQCCHGVNTCFSRIFIDRALYCTWLQTKGMNYGWECICNELSTKLEAKDVLPNINRTQAAERPKMLLLSLVTLAADLDILTLPSEGPNTSSLWIWRKSVYWFWRFHTQTKKSQTAPKTEP